jgi:LytS/YehU family sensor histidine kinase
LFWAIYSIYVFANPPLYKFGVKPVIYTAIVLYLTYGGAYFFTVKWISPNYLQKNKVGKGLLFVLGTAVLQQLIFGPISNYFLPFGNPFLEWFLFNLPFSCIILLLAAGVSVFTDYLYVVRKVQTLELLKAKQEIFQLKSQINPHFLFNTLNSLYSLARENSAKTAPVILQLSELMRYLIEISQRDLVLLTDEINFLKSYVAMEKLRLNEDAVCEFNISPHQYSEFKLPPLLLLPFVENAFKHGVELNPDQVDIHFFLAVQNGVLFFESNNAIAATKHTNTTGTGLNNIKKRLELLFGANFQLEIEEKNQRHSVKLSFQLK